LPPEIAPTLQRGAMLTVDPTVQLRLTLPVLKPPLGVMVTVEVADPPGVTEDGDRAEAAMVKPWKVAVTV
jgi:hypothetical protein